MDWDGNNRSQRVDLLDWTTNSLLDSRTISSFNGGQYLIWDIRGRVKIVVNKTGAQECRHQWYLFRRQRTGPNSDTYTDAQRRLPITGAPQVSLTVPNNGSTFVAGTNITLAANATDADGSISKVEFYRNSTLIGTDTSSPYSVVWTNAAKG